MFKVFQPFFHEIKLVLRRKIKFTDFTTSETSARFKTSPTSFKFKTLQHELFNA